MVASYKKYAEIRDRKGLTDYAVSLESKVSAATLSAWKLGQYAPKLDKLYKISRFLGCLVDDLLEEKEGD